MKDKFENLAAIGGGRKGSVRVVYFRGLA